MLFRQLPICNLHHNSRKHEMKATHELFAIACPMRAEFRGCRHRASRQTAASYETVSACHANCHEVNVDHSRSHTHLQTLPACEASST